MDFGGDMESQEMCIKDDISYAEWMSRWEENISSDVRFNGITDIEYNIVDDLFHQGWSPDDAVSEYLDRMN